MREFSPEGRQCTHGRSSSQPHSSSTRDNDSSEGFINRGDAAHDFKTCCVSPIARRGGTCRLRTPCMSLVEAVLVVHTASCSSDFLVLSRTVLQRYDLLVTTALHCLLTAATPKSTYIQTRMASIPRGEINLLNSLDCPDCTAKSMISDRISKGSFDMWQELRARRRFCASNAASIST